MSVEVEQSLSTFIQISSSFEMKYFRDQHTKIGNFTKYQIRHPVLVLKSIQYLTNKCTIFKLTCGD